MAGDGLPELRRRTTLVRGINPRGARHGAQLRAAKLVCGRSVWILTMMQSCASAAKLRAAGPFSPSAFGATSATGSATSDRRPAVPVVDASSERRAGKEMILQRFVSLPDAG